MTNGNDNDDAFLTKAMRSEGYEAFEEEGIFKQMLGTVRGRNAWMGVLSFVYTFIFAIIMFYALYRFFTSEATKDIAFWGVIAVLTAVAVSQLKMWLFIQMQRNTILRELKRMELQMAKLNEKSAG